MNCSVGTFLMTPPGPFEAGAFTTITFTMKIGEKGIKEGGCIKISTPNMGWGQPLCRTPRECPELVMGTERIHNPWKPLNTRCFVETKSTAIIVPESREAVFFIPEGSGAYAGKGILENCNQWRWWITLKVEKAPLEKGDIIKVTYGDTLENAGGIRVQPWPESQRGLNFVAIADIEGNNRFYEFDGSPREIEVGAGPPEKLKTVLPSIIKTNSPVKTRMKVLDRNLCPPGHEWTEKPRITEKKGEIEIVGPGNFIAQKTGIVKVWGRGPEKTTSNPALAESKPSHNLYWGDLHAQSMYHQWSPEIQRGDSSLRPAELHAYARDCAMLDFTALTDGFGAYETNPGWHEIQQAAIDFYEPGRYVPFKGWECGMGKQGDKCVVYRSAETEGYIPEMKASENCPSASHALTRFYKNHEEKVLTIPHSFMKYLDWSVLDPELDRVMEIYSSWGSYESRSDNPLNSKKQPLNQSAQYIWSRGALLGITAAGDSHLGYPGRSLPYSDRYHCQCFKAGICGVYAEKLTRETLWDAIYNRHCYGTTGERIILRFELNGNRMGSVLEYSETAVGLTNRKIKVFVAGTDLIRRVDVMKNNCLLYRHCPESDSADFVFEDKPHEKPDTRDWYYVRVFQADGNAAWSSPVWVGPENHPFPTETDIQ